MSVKASTPVTFELPDGDSVALIPWAYVVEKLDEALTPVLDSIEIINTKLTVIDNQLSNWLN